MQPITTYSEQRIGEERRFEVHDGSLLLFWYQTFGTRAQAAFDLADLNARPHRVWIRDRRFESIMSFSILFVLVAVSLVPYLFLGSDTFIDHWVKVLVVFIIGVLASVLFLIFNPRRIEYAQFVNHFGVVQVSIGRVGRSKAFFDDFVRRLSEEIAAAQPPDRA